MKSSPVVTLFLFAMVSAAGAADLTAAPIDRAAVVARHAPRLHAIDPLAPLTVGNGRLAYTADVTGLQTLPALYHANGIPLETQARWSWHEDANPHGYKLADANVDYTAHGRTIGYPTRAKSPAGQWLRENPHIQPLPRIGFVLTPAQKGAAAQAIAAADISAIDQHLDLWRGQLHSRWQLQGQAVEVRSAVSPGSDTLALSIRSPLLAQHQLAVRIALPYGYAPAATHHNPPLDFSGSTDPRAAELERRVVLSQYLTAVQMGDTLPASESGLTTSTWYGKHHTEMVWWHTAHFALWGRPEFTARTLSWYQQTLPAARAVARERGLQGARWMKMTGPEGRESPGGNPLIVWNQPHPIHLAELLYRADPTPATLARYRELVFDTAATMASMLHRDEAGQRYVLGPPLWIAQEIYDQRTSMNPAYELSYWARGLEIAQQWRERLGMAREPDWEARRRGLSALPVKDGKYVALESTPDTWDNIDSRHDHPSFLMALGQLPGDGVDRETMRRTLHAVLSQWDWKTKIWGWDYPMIAMTAARLGETAAAVDVLLKTDGPNNGYTQAGHNTNFRLPVYLPGNGALLAAVALMAGGWDGAPDVPAPGFPQDGAWKVRAEGFQRLP